ncbi:hypothetical protein ABZ400_36655 [Streptomyces sp. NPDC005897]|uniref:hypothetical protein n=1 Tax=Streptomyces sp. NPDC005897 TaxID=3157081 RepID=UPI0033CA1F57
MANNGQTDTAVLVAMLSERAAVNVRLALVADGQQWQLHRGQVILDDDTPVTERVWRYRTASFLELRLPGPTVAALLRGDEQDIHGLQVVAPGPPPSSASTSRLRGQQEWDRMTTPWPRTEWTLNRDANAPARPRPAGRGRPLFPELRSGPQRLPAPAPPRQQRGPLGPVAHRPAAASGLA